MASLYVGCLIVQVFLVGLDIFADTDASIHRDFAYVYGWLTPVLVLLAGFAEAPKSTRRLTIVLVVLFAIQIVLPSLRDVYQSWPPSIRSTPWRSSRWRWPWRGRRPICSVRGLPIR